MTNIGKAIIEKCGAKFKFNNNWCSVVETKDKDIKYKYEGTLP